MALSDHGQYSGVVDNADGYNGPYQFYNDKAVEEAIAAGRARLGRPHD